MNIAHHIERGRRLFPRKIALRFEGASLTYEMLDNQVNRAANALTALGVDQGDRVGLLLPNMPAFVIAYLGTLKIGAVAVSLNTQLKRAEIRHILYDCGALVLVTTEQLRGKVFGKDVPQLRWIIIAEGHAAAELSFDLLLAQASPDAQARDLDRDAPAAILYTSGTTGFPKGATLSHANVVSNMYAKNHYLRMGPDDRLLQCLPLFHCFGQNAILNSGLNACATIVLLPEFEPDRVLRAIADERVTMFFGVPTIYKILLDRGVTSADLRSVRFYLSAAAPLPEEVARRWHATIGYMINEGYGLTETSPFACYNHDLKYKYGSIGTPIENVEMRVVDAEDHPVGLGETGEIVIRGPNVMLGYWNRPLDTERAIVGGWLHTGDIGTMDDEGYLYVVDRLKDMINVAGQKVFPTEVENVLYQHPAVAEAAVYGVPHVVMGEMVRADVIRRPGDQTTRGELLAFCHQRLATFKVPSRITFVDVLPKNATGKVLKKALRERSA